MLNWLSRRNERKRNAHNLYGSIVALSRDEVIYTDYQVPDTVEGRFEILMLHMFVILERLKDESGALAQDIVDLFFADMDTTTRELGVGDMAVPKKMRKLARLYAERIEEYGAAFETSDALEELLRVNVYMSAPTNKKSVKALAGYVRRLRNALSNKKLEELVTDGFIKQSVKRVR